MRRRAWLVGAAGVAALIAAVIGGWFGRPRPAHAQPANGLQWIWADEGDPLKKAPAGTRYFRKTFKLARDFADEASLDITADNSFTVWVNGKKVGEGNLWERVYRFDVTKLLTKGANVIAVAATNESEGAAGLLVKLGYTPNGQSKVALYSDASWKFAKDAPEGWQNPGFDDSKWGRAKSLVGYGKGGPWTNIAWDAGGDDRFSVPPGFRVEMLVPPGTKVPGLDPKIQFSLVNMCFDARGRLFASQERGPVVLFAEPDKKGAFQKVIPYCNVVRNCQGMCWIKGWLYLVGDGPKGVGIYRGKPTAGDRIDEVELLAKYKGGMGEHGPHAVVHGPDDKLYVVNGNHSWLEVDKLAANSPLTRWPHGQPGPDQDQPNSTQDVLLPRQNDARGHAANILAPGGTIWRMELDGSNPALVAAGFRNEFDAAFNPDGELFSFDSDMEWDEALPWYRPVRVTHCIPGAEFGWRTGSSKIPPYDLDTLPAVVDTGRGSPTGVEFYDHVVFPKEYRGAFFLCDWSIGVIWAVHLEKKGATYAGKLERFCSGSPMPVTDCAVAPDGSLYFTVGGRQTAGGVYRIVYDKAETAKIPDDVQPLAPWSKVRDRRGPSDRIASDEQIAKEAVSNENPAYRARCVLELGMMPADKARDPLLKALKDQDPFVRRRACEALIRAGIEPPVESLKPLLADKDRFLGTAARLVLQRIDPAKWAEALVGDANDLLAEQAIIALCKVNRAEPFAEKIFARLGKKPDTNDVQALLNHLRTLELALIHTQARPAGLKAIASRCVEWFPQADDRVNRELAILMVHFQKEGQLDKPVQPKLMAALEASKGDRPQQIHYFYCMRLLKNGWTEPEKAALLAWYDSTKTWTGGASFTPFLENILKDANAIFTPEDRAAALAKADKHPLAAMAMLRMARPDQLPPPAKLGDLYADIASKPKLPRADEFKSAIVESLVRSPSPQAAAGLRKIADADPAQRLAVARALAKNPSPENLPYVVRGLEAAQMPTLLDLIETLKRVQAKPKPDDAAAFRAVLLATNRLPANQRWKVVELLRHWTNGRQFGAPNGQWKQELASWGRWYGQSFPKEPALPDFVVEKPSEGKYKFGELLAYLEKTKGDPAKGKAVFTKAVCIKCHKFGNEGEGIGPDLSTVSKRFKRAEILESIIYPSKVISDQYRSTKITTLDGETYIGLAAVMGDNVTILREDASKVTIKKGDIDRQVASLVSVMPEKLLDPLSKEEIADLLAYLETEPVVEKK